MISMHREFDGWGWHSCRGTVRKQLSSQSSGFRMVLSGFPLFLRDSGNIKGFVIWQMETKSP